MVVWEIVQSSRVWEDEVLPCAFMGCLSSQGFRQLYCLLSERSVLNAAWSNLHLVYTKMNELSGKAPG